MDQIKHLFNKNPPTNQNKNQFHPVQQFKRDNSNQNINQNKYNLNQKPNQYFHQPNKDVNMTDVNSSQRQISPDASNQFPNANNPISVQFQNKMNKIKNNLRQFAAEPPIPNRPRRTSPNYTEVPQERNMGQGQNKRPNMKREINQRMKRKRIQYEYPPNLYTQKDYQDIKQIHYSEENNAEKDTNATYANFQNKKGYYNDDDDYDDEDYTFNDQNKDNITNEYYAYKSNRFQRKELQKPLNVPQTTINTLSNEDKPLIESKAIKPLRVLPSKLKNKDKPIKPLRMVPSRLKNKDNPISKTPQNRANIKKTNIDITKIIEIQEKSKRSMSPLMQINNNNTLNNQSSKEDHVPPSSTKIKGQLEAMCSQSEVIERESQNLLSIFEIDHSKTTIDPVTNVEMKKAKKEYAIKAYLRPGGDLNKYDPQNIRTPHILRETVNYIIDNIVDSDHNDHSPYGNNSPIPFSEICLFANDRFKAIRQDITVQELKSNKECIESNELIARFLILCLNETLDEKSISGKQGLYELNMVQLNSTLTSLYEFYEYNWNQMEKDAKDEGYSSNVSIYDYYISPNEEEFIAYFLLIALKQKPIEFISILSKIPKNKQKGRRLGLALSIAKTILSHDWNAFMKILRSKECDYLTACIMVLFFTDIRFLALTELSYINKPPIAIYLISINQLLHLLPFEDNSECIDFLNWFGINTPYSAISNPNEKFELLRRNMSSDYKFIYAPMKTNHRYIQTKKGILTRREVILRNDFSHQSLEQKEIINKHPIKPIKPITIIEITPIKELTQSYNPAPIKKPSKPIKSITEDSSEGKIEEKKFNVGIKQDMSPYNEDNIFNKGKIQYLISVCDLIAKVYLIRHKYSLLSQLKIIIEQDKIVSQFKRASIKHKKRMILLSWRKLSIKSKYNLEYQKELLKYNMNINSIEHTYSMKPKSSLLLYNYDELLYFLIEKYEKDLINSNSSPRNEIDLDPLIHLQVNIYTTRDLLISTHIIQKLSINNENAQSTNEEIIISSRIHKDQKAFWFFIKIIFLEQITTNDSIENYIFVNQQSLAKFSYGLVFFDYTNDILLKTFIALIDQSLGKYIKKRFIFGFCINNSMDNDAFDLLHQSYLSLVDKYHYIDDDDYIPRTVCFANLNAFSSYFTDLLIHHNNSAFLSLFKETNMIAFQSYTSMPSNTIPLKRIQKMIKIEYNMRALRQAYHFSKNNYLIEETLLSIALIKTIALFYLLKLSNDLNIMMNIPSYVTESNVENKEMIYLQLIKYFDYIQGINLKCNIVNSKNVSNSYMESPLAYFDILYKYLIDYDFSYLFGISYNESVMKCEYNYKREFSLSLAKGMSGIVLSFFNGVIEFISDNIGIEINWSSDECKVFERIANENKEKRLNEVKECMSALIDNCILPNVKMNEMLTKDDFPYFSQSINITPQKSFLNKKRVRFDHNEYDKQLSMQIISYDKTDDSNSYCSSKDFVSDSYLMLNKKPQYTFNPKLVSYIIQ